MAEIKRYKSQLELEIFYFNSTFFTQDIHFMLGSFSNRLFLESWNWPSCYHFFVGMASICKSNSNTNHALSCMEHGAYFSATNCYIKTALCSAYRSKASIRPSLKCHGNVKLFQLYTTLILAGDVTVKPDRLPEVILTTDHGEIRICGYCRSHWNLPESDRYRFVH